VKKSLESIGWSTPPPISSSTVLLRIAGLVIRLDVQPGGPPLAVSGAAASFLVDRGSPDVDIAVQWGDLETTPGGRLVFESGGVWMLHQVEDRLSYTFTSPTLGGTYRHAIFDREFRRGLVTLDRSRFSGRPATYPLEYPLDELVVINRLTYEQGIEVHGCGIVDADGRGYLFAGQSGAGKSTMARFWAAAGATVLSDDRIVLRVEGNEIRMHGTPWHGDAEYAEPLSAPLCSLLFLRQARTHALTPVLAAAAGALLFSCAFPVFHSADALARTLTVLERLVDALDVGVLDFAPTSDVVSFVRHSNL
jgi:hypothetical protein